MVNFTYYAEVVRWVDGDTVWLKVDLGFRASLTTDFRLAGVDTPERGRPNHTPATRLANELAPVGSTVRIQTFKNPDKYGRWLAEVFPSGAVNSVNQELLLAGLATPYQGGTRP